MHNILLYMKKLYRFRESRMLPAVDPDDVNAVLGVLDMGTVTGRWDYAIILLGWVTGLRAVDIIRLKLRDIDWKNGEIRILLRKTSSPVILPLTAGVGTALQGYILNWEPACGC